VFCWTGSLDNKAQKFSQSEKGFHEMTFSRAVQDAHLPGTFIDVCISLKMKYG